MNYFIFQSVPQQFDLRDKLIPGEKDTWYATRYRAEMQPGDIVFFWMGGDERARGLYGWGRLESKAYAKPSWDSHGVDVQYEAKFATPILEDVVRKVPELDDMLLFRARQATNFLLSEKQARRLAKLIERHGASAPMVGGAIA